MSKSSVAHHEELQHLVAEGYERDGYEVSIQPGPGAIPFDLGGYRPDLIARKGDVSLIVEIKTQPERVSFEQLRLVVDAVKRHEGWRFVLVTPRDVPSIGLPDASEDQFTWGDVADRIEDANRLSQMGQQDSAYLALWIQFERMMRFQARRIGLPIDRLAPSVLIRQLYSQGELSMPQFDAALACQGVRNRIVHGFRAIELSEATARLNNLVGELRRQWSAPMSDG